MTVLYAVVAAVAAQRLAELALARWNTARLIARGGVEHGARHYPLFVALHAAWLVSLPAALPAETPADWRLLGLYGALQPVRYWCIRALGNYWTTRVIVVPGAAPVHRGPYRFLRHPNYAVVACEIALLPLVFGAWRIALAFSLLNLALLAHRVRVEDAARRGPR